MTPRERELHRRRASRSGGAERVDEGRDGEPTTESEPHVLKRVGELAEVHRTHDGERRTAANTEDRWSGERVSRCRLHHSARDGERRADADPDDGAWQAQRADDGLFVGVGVVVEERVQRIGRRDPEGANPKAEQADDQRGRTCQDEAGGERETHNSRALGRGVSTEGGFSSRHSYSVMSFASGVQNARGARLSAKVSRRKRERRGD